VAPLLPSAAPANLLLPRIEVDGIGYAADLLDLGALPLGALGEVVASALGSADAIANGLDAIFRGIPVGLPGP